MYPQIRAIFLVGFKDEMRKDDQIRLEYEEGHYCDILQGRLHIDDIIGPLNAI